MGYDTVVINRDIGDPYASIEVVQNDFGRLECLIEQCMMAVWLS